MSSSDSRMFEALVERVDALERLFEALVERVDALERRVTALADLAEGKDLSGDLYGEAADHTADRAERAEIARRVPRPPGGVR